jgi:DNA-binding HxlR family transcriptional regulator
VEYSLTNIRKSLFPVIEQLGEWGKQYNINFNYGKIEFEDHYEEDL